MDDDRFDSLTASLATSPTRRTALRLLAVIVAGLASLFGWSERHPAATKKRQRHHRHKKPQHKRHHKHKPKGKGKGKGKQCSAESKQCNGECIDATACCTSDECGDGGVCDEQHACVCAPEYKTCEDTCILASECCGGCPKGMTCEESVCVCAPEYKPCDGACIAESECCDHCPKGMTCNEGECVCAPEYTVCGDSCIPDTECCGGCPKGMACEEGECVGNGKALYPDLRTLPARDLAFDTLRDGTSILRFSNSVWNAGEGRLELQGDPTPQPDPNVVKKVYQNLYDAPIGGILVSHKQVASDFIYHPAHMHFHFANFASYLLLAQDATGIYQQTTKQGTKTSFCITDSNPIEGTYPAQYDTCGTDRQGLTPGWADTYGYQLADQWVVLGTEPLSDGEYAVQSIADPKRLLDEGGGKRESNNSSITYFTVQDGAIVNVRDQP